MRYAVWVRYSDGRPGIYLSDDADTLEEAQDSYNLFVAWQDNEVIVYDRCLSKIIMSSYGR